MLCPALPVNWRTGAESSMTELSIKHQAASSSPYPVLTVRPLCFAYQEQCEHCCAPASRIHETRSAGGAICSGAEGLQRLRRQLAEVFRFCSGRPMFPAHPCAPFATPPTGGKCAPFSTPGTLRGGIVSEWCRRRCWRSATCTRPGSRRCSPDPGRARSVYHPFASRRRCSAQLGTSWSIIDELDKVRSASRTEEWLAPWRMQGVPEAAARRQRRRTPLSAPLPGPTSAGPRHRSGRKAAHRPLAESLSESTAASSSHSSGPRWRRPQLSWV
jgi:hypothetical protein